MNLTAWIRSSPCSGSITKGSPIGVSIILTDARDHSMPLHGGGDFDRHGDLRGLPQRRPVRFTRDDLPFRSLGEARAPVGEVLLAHLKRQEGDAWDSSSSR